MELWLARSTTSKFQPTVWSESKRTSTLTKSPSPLSKVYQQPPGRLAEFFASKICPPRTQQPRVLHDVSFEIQSGQRVGVVGRSGSGKSSLTLALLRGILTEGSVTYDGIRTDSINLHALRNTITIVPPIPELLSDTVRSSHDPFGQHTEAIMNDALRSAGLFSLQADMEDESGKISLESMISSGGSNLSVGQKQLLALARAIVRGSKLLILDEATSAIDYKTDAIIQNSLRTELPKDVTLTIVAHRLQTIMDTDKLLGLDAGRVVEPLQLLKNDKGFLRTMVDESGDKTLLYAMAG